MSRPASARPRCTGPTSTCWSSTADGGVAAYGLFWFDPATATGLVEPMRTEDDHQRRGLARHVLTAGVDLLAGPARPHQDLLRAGERGIERALPRCGLRAHRPDRRLRPPSRRPHHRGEVRSVVTGIRERRSGRWHTSWTSRTSPRSAWSRRRSRTPWPGCGPTRRATSRTSTTSTSPSSPPSKAKKTVDWVTGILRDERDLVIASPPLEATAFEAAGIRFAYVFYESGLGINVMYEIADGGKRAVGFKLSEGMDVPAELADRFKFAAAEVEAGRHDPRLVLRDQGRALTRRGHGTTWVAERRTRWRRYTIPLSNRRSSSSSSWTRASPENAGLPRTDDHRTRRRGGTRRPARRRTRGPASSAPPT